MLDTISTQITLITEHEKSLAQIIDQDKPDISHLIKVLVIYNTYNVANDNSP